MRHTTTSPPLLVSVATAAAMLAVSAVTIRRMMRDGRLPTVPIGGAVRIPRRAIEALATPSAFHCRAIIANPDEDDAPSS